MVLLDITKDVLPLLFTAITVLFGGITVWKALKEFSENREQRKKDLNWKQAEAARQIIYEWLEDTEAYAFCRMIEYENRTFKNEEKQSFRCTNQLIIDALTHDEVDTALSPEEVNKRFIRDSCDSFLFYSEMMSQGLKGHLYRIENLLFPLNYYLDRMKQKNLYYTFINYAEKNSYNKSTNLFREIVKD